MNKVIIDTSAWIEYYNATTKGLRVREFVDKFGVLTTGMIAAELSAKFGREGKPVNEMLYSLRSLAMLVPIDFSIGASTGHIFNEQRKQRLKFGMLDAHVVAVARLHGAQVVTCDTDFLGIPEAIVIK